MPRANRTFIAGHYWHITHRCHRKQFLLENSVDRKRWLYWVYQARKRYDFCVLNYMVTSNHIHLLVHDRGKGEIARSMQLLAGRTAQEFNSSHGRQGAFWADRYHATAVESGAHLLRCMLYIDLNMVRAGLVSHPRDWPHSGYHEIMYPKARGRRINYASLLEALNYESLTQLQTSYKIWLDALLPTVSTRREPLWTESLAIGGLAFTRRIQSELGGCARKRKRTLESIGYALK
ncbi:MAG: transposase [Acidiferrobacterales bacterium]|nr:transposase [Acidiferrobacterales bacterium]